MKKKSTLRIRIPELCAETAATVAIFDGAQGKTIKEPVNNAFRLGRLLNLKSSETFVTLWEGIAPKTGKPPTKFYREHLEAVIKKFGLTAESPLGMLFDGLPSNNGKPSKAKPIKKTKAGKQKESEVG